MGQKKKRLLTYSAETKQLAQEQDKKTLKKKVCHVWAIEADIFVLLPGIYCTCIYRETMHKYFGGGRILPMIFHYFFFLIFTTLHVLSVKMKYKGDHDSFASQTWVMNMIAYVNHNEV